MNGEIIELVVLQRMKKKNKVSPEHYTEGQIIAYSQLQDEIVEVVVSAEKTREGKRLVFKIQRRRNGIEEPHTKTATTHYQKAIGLAIQMVYDWEENH